MKKLCKRSLVSLLGIIAIGVVIMVGLAGCDNGSGGGGTNPFIGIWSGTVTISGQSAQGTISVTSSGWGISVPQAGMSGAGTYTYNDNVATLKDEANDTIGTATISGNKLTLSITDGYYAGFHGSFSK
jgi:hypothetical protein